jgi:hypothetical protein
LGYTFLDDYCDNLVKIKGGFKKKACVLHLRPNFDPLGSMPKYLSV